MITNDSQRARLNVLMSELIARPDFSASADLVRFSCLHHEAAPLIGHVLLDALEEAGYGSEDIDFLRVNTADAALIGAALLHACASRGLDTDVIDNVNAGSAVTVQGGSAVAVLVVAACETVADITAAIQTDSAIGIQVEAIATVLPPCKELEEYAKTTGIALISAVNL